MTKSRSRQRRKSQTSGPPEDRTADTDGEHLPPGAPEEGSEGVPEQVSSDVPETEPTPGPAESTAELEPRARGLAVPLWMLRAAHPRQALVTAAGLGGAAAATGRPSREIALVFVTALVGQTVLGWHNDLVDAATDRAHERRGKPVAQGRLDPGNLWFALCCGVLLLIPLAVTNGVVAGACYLASVAIGMLGNVVLRRGFLSFVPWAAAFALYPAFLYYGGWGGGADIDTAPEPVLWWMMGLAALLGVATHFFLAVWGLVADHEDHWRYLPLRVGFRIGATRLMILALFVGAVVVGAMVYLADRVGILG